MLEVTYYWQLKEYRYDRMKQFLLEQGGGARLLSPLVLGYVVLVLLFAVLRLVVPDEPRISSGFQLLIGVLLLAECLQAFHRGVERKLKKPRLTTKALFILAASSLLAFLPLTILISQHEPNADFTQPTLLMALIAILTPDLVSVVVLFSNQISGFFRQRRYRAAQKKRLSRRDLTVIGVTGSFGKTSVKEFLSALLSKHFRVLKTEKNINTEIGISQTILQELQPQHQIFVAEMGAYERGEIRRSCLIARPKIGILTGLNDQHAALFGGIDKTFQAKWELAHSLPPDGLLVVNGESQELCERLQQAPCRTIVCFLDEAKPIPISAVTAVAHTIQVEPNRVSFSYHEKCYSVPLIGRFQVINVLMAIVVALELGMKTQEIEKAASKLVSPEKTMLLKSFKKGFLIDDSYNVNPSGLREALAHLSHFPEQQKVIFFPGIIELGERSTALHEELGRLIGHAVDYAFFYDPHFTEPLIRGALSAGLTRERIIQATSQEEMQKQLQALFSKHPAETWVILFESRGAEKVLMSL